MRRRIPSTSSLLAFEAAARHGNFSRAAEELSLTEGAISRQISRLEAFLGVQLFVRAKSRVHLTDAARTYRERVASLLARIEQDTLGVMGRANSGVLELAVIPTFTNRWLIPRLPRFLAKHPGVTINMTERPEPFLFSDSPFDAAIHYDHPAWTGMVKQILFAEELVAVCLPQLLATGRDETLARLPLLHKRGRVEEWKRWWEAIGIDHINAMAGPKYDLYSMVIEAARAGLGAALVPRLYVQDELADGTFVMPRVIAHAGDKSYCVVYPDSKREQRPLSDFIAWLESETKQYVHARERLRSERARPMRLVKR